MKILVVEDDQTVVQALHHVLSSYNYAVDIAIDGEAGLQMADTFEYDLMLLDILLPQVDGVSLCQQLRAKGFQTPILLLTGQGGGRQKAIALNAGADDYVVKPFDAEELIARVQALLRRGGPKTQPILRWGDLSVDPSSCSVTYGPHLLSVRPKEYAILELFLRNPRTVFSSQAILEHVWNSGESPGEETVRVHIKELRKKIKEAGAPKDFIKTIYRTGYQLNPLYSSVLDPQTDEQQTATQVSKLKSVNKELRATVAALQSTQAERSQQNQVLESAYQKPEQERQQLQTVCEEEELAHATRPKDELIANISHEFRTPLNAIIRDPLVVSTDTTVMDAITQMSGLRSQCSATRTADGQLVDDIHLRVRSSCVIVVEDEQVVGILTERDVVRVSAQQQPLDCLVMRQVMAHPVITLRESALTDLFSAINRLQQHHTRHLPILDEQDRLVGLLTHASLRRICRPIDLLRLRVVSEVMTRKVICAAPDCSMLEIAHLIADCRVSSVVIAEPSDDPADPLQIPVGILTERDLVQFQALGLNLESCAAKAVMSTPIFSVLPEESLWAVQQIMEQRLIRRVVVTGEQGELLGIVTQSSVLQALNPLELYKLAEFLEAKVVRLEAEKLSLLKSRTIELKRQVAAQTAELRATAEREKLLAELATQIRSSLSLQTILDTTVEQVRQVLGCDRVNIWRFEADGQSIVVAESTDSPLSLMGERVNDSCLQDYIEIYRQGRIRVIPDIYTAEMSDCHREMLLRLQTRAKILAPLLCDDELWGVLNISESQHARDWSPEEVELLQALSVQLAIALQQATKHQQLQAELSARQQAEARWQFALEGAGDGVWDWNAQTNTVFYSRQWKAMLGYAEHEVGNRLEDWESRIHSDDKARCYADLNKHLSGETPAYQNEHRIRCKDGGYKWILNRSKVIEWTLDGQPMRVIGTHTDITDRKRAEQKIREHAALIDIATDAIFVRDLENRIVFWSQGAAQLYGWTAAEVLGQLAHEFFDREAAANFEAGLKIVMEKGFWQGEMAQTTKAGNEILVASRWTLVRDTSGHPKSLLVVNTDITEKKQLETQFYQAQRLESLGGLASGVAHDLNNIFTPILAIAQLLRLTQQDMDAQVWERLKLVEDSAKRGANMVKQILTFAQGRNGERTPVDLFPLLREVINIAQECFPKFIEIRHALPDPDSPNQLLGMVSADPTQLHQVLMNLCINARDAMPNGGILTLSAENFFVDQAIAHMNWDAQVGNYVVVTIADTGTGIAPEIQDRMFDPFFTTKEAGQGTGLGLSTVLGIVKSYGGFLQVSSEVGSGTQVKVFFPAIEGIPVESSQLKEQFNGKGELVLIVDDDVAVQRATQDLLESHHYTTLVANDGVQAIKLYAQHQDEIRLVVLDVMMPNMGGIPLIQRLKTIKPMVKIIAISGLPANQEPVLAAGANVFLAKPYPLGNFLRNVCDLVT